MVAVKLAKNTSELNRPAQTKRTLFLYFNLQHEFTYHITVMHFTLPIGDPIKMGLKPILGCNPKFGKRWCKVNRFKPTGFF